MREENDEKLRRFNAEWDAAHSTEDTKPPLDIGGSGHSKLTDAIHNQPDAIHNQTITSTTQGAFQPPVIPTTGDSCNQCNVLHPPLRPGETCPNASPAETKEAEVVPQTPAVSPPTDSTVKEPVINTVTPPINTETVSEPAPLADNNIPTEIHVNKYLSSWGDQIQAHCKANGIQNVKKLMRHITIEITDFLENYKGK